ncbi:hypothetical protein RHSIM_Rhsim11G0071500 [Rhododendron simsii]|uniref:BRCT domain-containing protein n=1 Tax=Rhododendron simsii TaxID=118357 RepID=A0A834LBQ2_RHOSS|nr:hypothetical protein RHSIM_Rhsim11G0071500 [Rhododendron simsii]
MDGVKVLASGFEMDEKLEIGKMVTAMGGVLHTKASLDVSFVIWAANVLKKPIVTLNWLHQCWKEHRVVPQESYRVLPFTGLTISITRIPAGDKYKVAKRWGNIHIVPRKWFDQSVARRVCLNEESYPVQDGSSSLMNGTRTCSLAQRIQEKSIGNSQCAPSSFAGGSNLEAVLCSGIIDPDLEATLSQNISTTFSDASILVKEESGTPAKQAKCDTNFDGCVADDSQNEDDDLYLSDCRILLIGFDASEMRKLVNMVRRGGGSRYMSFNEKLTHIVVGSPSEIEKKEVRGLAALGVINMVRTTWLEDCDHEKKEVPVQRRHIAYDLLLLKDPVCSNKGGGMGMAGMKGKASTVQPILPEDQVRGASNSGSGIPFVERKELEVNLNGDDSLRATVRPDKQSQFSALDGKDKDQQKTKLQTCNEFQNLKSLVVFKGKLFQFSNSFPPDRRAEIIEWVNKGGGAMVDAETGQNAHFTVECHGVIPSPAAASRTTHVSSHWIRTCLEGQVYYSPSYGPTNSMFAFRYTGRLDHMFYSLIPRAYSEMDVCLKWALTSSILHYHAGFLYLGSNHFAFVSHRQDDVIAPGPFVPREVTSPDREAGLCTMSQYPTQATRMVTGDTPSQFPSQIQDLRNIQAQASGRSSSSTEEANVPSFHCKRARLLHDDRNKGLISSTSNHSDPTSSTGNNLLQKTEETSNAVPDVASAIEDLLEETSKFQSLILEQLYSDCSILGQDHADSHSAFVMDFDTHFPALVASNKARVDISTSALGKNSSSFVNNQSTSGILLNHLESVTVPVSPSVRQLETLTAENLCLRSELAKAQASGVSGKDTDKVMESPTPHAQPSSWKDKVTVNSGVHHRLNLEFLPPLVLEDRVVISPPPEVELGLAKWKNCLVGHFLDKKVPFPLVRNITMKIWEKFGLSDVLANDLGFFFFFFIFSHDAAMGKVLDAGPWLIAGKMLVLKLWKPHMALIKEKFQCVPKWVHFYNVPFEYWMESGLSCIAISVGIPLYADDMTARCKRMSFVKVCVEINLESKLPNSFDLKCPNGDTVIVEVKYPWLPLKCMRCKIFGHSDAHCPNRPKEVLVPAMEGVKTNVPAGQSGGCPSPVLIGCSSSPAKVVTSGACKPSEVRSLVGQTGDCSSPAPKAPGSTKGLSPHPLSRILICDDAAIEKVVQQYATGPSSTSTRANPSACSILPSENELGDIGFVTNASQNKFSTLVGVGLGVGESVDDVGDSVPGGGPGLVAPVPEVSFSGQRGGVPSDPKNGKPKNKVLAGHRSFFASIVYGFNLAQDRISLWNDLRTDGKDDTSNRSRDVNAGMYDGFSETQTESQVVGYEEDLSGRQMIIDRVRTRSSLI